MRRLTLLWAIMIGLAAPSSAETYIVDPHGTGDFPTIQAAVDAAASGDIIELTDGIFLGDGNRNIDYGGKLLTIRSQSGDPRTCIVDCELQGRGFVGSLPGRLEGITVTRGWGGDWGGAIMIYDGSFSVHNCILSDNHAAGNGGAVFIDLCSGITFTECTFVGNVGGPGGAICT